MSAQGVDQGGASVVATNIPHALLRSRVLDALRDDERMGSVTRTVSTAMRTRDVVTVWTWVADGVAVDGRAVARMARVTVRRGERLRRTAVDGFGGATRTTYVVVARSAGGAAEKIAGTGSREIAVSERFPSSPAVMYDHGMKTEIASFDDTQTPTRSVVFNATPRNVEIVSVGHGVGGDRFRQERLADVRLNARQVARLYAALGAWLDTNGGN